MEGVILNVEKEELQEMISQAVTDALIKKEELEKQQVPKDFEVMRTEGLCKYLKIKRSAVYQLTTYKRIPYFKRGKRVFFRKNEIDEWLRNGRQATVFRGDEEERLTKAGKRIK